ncbi:MAG: DUF3750 domain-containing protein [Ectothiorhodospiraceae bacterium]|nr:DUF3750 domain-containing protein [Chromatiales bacterium]MCP5153686.1 DUF3750 domain-containing protein [Ectothiorhodospiraceae bacterium]
MRRAATLLLVLAAGPLLVAACGDVRLDGDWRTASRDVTGLAPDPATTPEAVVQVYAARAFKWRGVFAVHTWLATKAEGARHYAVHQVVGWRKYGNLPVVVSRLDAPDRAWYGAAPTLLAELRGPAAARAIPRIETAIADYPYARDYTVWPGPNSNTFTAFVARAVPELALDLPVTAIGKDYLPPTRPLAMAPSGTGVQVSLGGLLGATVALREGLELNLLGLVLGIDPLRPAIKLPGIGRLGMAREVRREAPI